MEFLSALNLFELQLSKFLFLSFHLNFLYVVVNSNQIHIYELKLRQFFNSECSSALLFTDKSSPHGSTQILPYICLTQYHISLRNSWRYRVCERGFMLKAVTEASLCADEREKLWGSSLAIPDSPLKAESFSPDLFVEISGVLTQHFKCARVTSLYTHTHTKNCC